MPEVIIGTAGWAIPAAWAPRLPAGGSQLARYAAVLGGVEINSSFYRSHRPQTYARWAASTPAHFRFSVKLPRSITHEARLQGAQALLERFADEAGELGAKWTVVLVQLPPSLALDEAVATAFFAQLRAACPVAIVCEPRHDSWFTPAAEAWLAEAGVGRAGGDPAPWSGSAEALAASAPQPVYYYRWHGSPQRYRSAYASGWLADRAAAIAALPAQARAWCMFDNTASGAALGNALDLAGRL